jgi:hypothetical protein
MKNWSNKHIEKLQKDGKIRSFHIPERTKGFSSDKNGQQFSRTRTKALDWLGWNLPYWCNDHSLQLEKEYKFCTDRNWRFDWAIPSIKIAIEYEGGIFLQVSGHNTAKHYTKDTEKYNRATILGWRIIRITAMNYTTVLSQLNELIK